MMYDTDVLIWFVRGSEKAARVIENDGEKSISVQSYMELLQGAHDRTEQEHLKDFIFTHDFAVLPLTENVGHRALVYVEEYALSSGMRSADALIAATAVENNAVLCTGNSRHFKAIRDLRLKAFRA
jgi:predicted nucleic acid-binding protein